MVVSPRGQLGVNYQKNLDAFGIIFIALEKTFVFFV